MRAMAPKGLALQRCRNARGHGLLLQAQPAVKANPAPANSQIAAPVGETAYIRKRPRISFSAYVVHGRWGPMNPSQTSHGSSDNTTLSPFVSPRKRDRISHP